MRHRRARGNRTTYCTTKKGQRKVRYKTLKDAKIARSSLVEHHVSEYVRIYKCPLCHGYHLTTQRPTKPNSTVWKDTESDDMSYNDTETQSKDEEN